MTLPYTFEQTGINDIARENKVRKYAEI